MMTIKEKQKYRYIGFEVLICLIGVCMMFYPTLISGFARMQTDTGDTRLTNYFLEHSFQFFFNKNYLGELWSPTFFYPYKEVLSFSENLFGSAPIYWFFRIFSSSDIAFQLWMIAVSALNFGTFSLLMRRFKVNYIIASLGSFLFAFGMPRIAKIGHQQLLPQFFTPLAFLALWEFVKKPTNIKLFLLLTSTYLQFLAGVYLGWFWIFSLIIFFVLISIFELEVKVKLLTYWKNNKKEISFIVLSWLFLNVITFLPYIKAKLVLNSRSYGEVDTMIPRLASWLSPPPGSFWNSSLGYFSRDLPMLHEHHLFMGFTMMTLAAISLYIFFKKKYLFDSEKTLLIKICFLVFIIIFILSLRLPFGISLWKIVYTIIPGASVIRAVSRIWTIAYFYLLIATFVCLDIFWKSLSGKVKWHNLILVIFLFLGIIEQATFSLPSYEKNPVLMQVSEISKLMQNKTRCDMAYFIPEITQENKFWDGINGHISTMWAGIESNIPVINGYSGNVPPEYQLFSFENTNALSIVGWLENSNQNIQGNLCLIISQQSDLKPNFLKGIGQGELLQQYNSSDFTTYVLPIPIPKQYNQKISLISPESNIKIINQTIEAVVTIENNSNFGWLNTNQNSQNPVRFSYRWFDKSNQLMEFEGDGIRTELPSDLRPGQKLALLVTIKTPPTAGQYELVLTMVEEGVTWFNDQDSDSTKFSLDIISP